MQPYLMEQTDSSCGNCSYEPQGPPNPFEAINFFLGIFQNIDSMAQKDDIFVYANYTVDKYGNLNVPSLTISNQSGADISVMNIRFSVSDSNNNYEYYLSEEEMITPSNKISGVRVGGNSRSVTNVSLVSTGDLLYPNNTFSTWKIVQIFVQLANSSTGQYYPLAPYTFYPPHR